MAEAPFTENEIQRFGRFLEALGIRLQADADFRRDVLGRQEDLVVERPGGVTQDVSVEFHPAEEEIVATVILPPGLRRQDVRLHVSRDQIELVLRERRLVILALPEPVSDRDVRATFRNNVLDVTMRKATG